MKLTNYTLAAISATGFFLFISSCQTTKKEESLEEKAIRIHEEVMTLDTHNDINVANFTDSLNYNNDLETQVNLPKMKKGGLDVSWFVVYTGQGPLTDEGYDAAYDNAISKFEAIHRLTEEYAPTEIGLATSSKEARTIHASGKKVAMIGIENGYPIGMDINRVKEFYELGARYMSLAHNGHSQLADSNTGEKDGIWMHDGLSDLGKDVIAEMNKWGIMIDLSHPSKEANRQMIELSRAPVIASHSSARGLSDHSRNLDDEQLAWIKKNGGVVQAVAFNLYVDTDKHRAYGKHLDSVVNIIAQNQNFEIKSWDEVRNMQSEMQGQYIATYRSMRKEATKVLAQDTPQVEAVNVADFVNHIDYLVEKLGIDHVGISSDFDGGGGVEGWMDASETPNITIELVKRGYTKEEIEKLWSANLLRALDEVQAVALEIQEEETIENSSE